MSQAQASRTLFAVPAGTKPTPCKRCGMSVFWVQVRGGWKLIDCSAVGGVEPSESKDTRQLGMFGGTEVRAGLGVNHFDDCPPDGAA
jgi:hypothetical protein